MPKTALSGRWNVAPDSIAITALVRVTYEQRGKQNAEYNDPEVIGGLTLFLDFLAQRSATPLLVPQVLQCLTGSAAQW